MSNTLKFPENFLWGSATSAHQIEGNTHNDWSEWEKSEQRARELKARGLDPRLFISGIACDSYNRYEEDFSIAQSLGHNVHRLSIEWSRIEPEEGKFSKAAIDHYVKVIETVKARGMVPVVTLWHFTNPLWFHNRGSWSNLRAPDYFLRFIKVVVPALKGKVGLWITFNEPSLWVGMGYIRSEWPPHKKNLFSALLARRNFIRAHKMAYKEIKRIYASPENATHPNPLNPTSHNVFDNMYEKGLVGVVEHNVHVVAAPWQKLLGLPWLINYFLNNYFYTKIKKFQDFIGVNYYTIKRLPGTLGILPRQSYVPEMDWEIYPEGIYHRLKDLKRYGRPIYITENGLPDEADTRRADYIKNHIIWMHKAISEGADVKGYMHWSLIDNLELAKGFGPRFGLVAIDYATLKRQVRPSALEYAKIIKANQIDV